MKKESRDDALRRLLRIRTRSSSEEEFRIRLAAEGGVRPLPVLLFRAYLFRKRHLALFEGFELALFGIGVSGFGLWCGIAGPKSALAGIGIILLAQAVMIPLTLALCRFDLFCSRMNGMEEDMR